MESVGSNSSSTNNNRPQRHRFYPTQPLAERVIRALRHGLRLLHRSGATFYILGATANVYTVTLSSTPTCSCPDRTTPCKHILFVYIQVLNISLDDACLWRRTLRPCQLHRLLSAPMSNKAIAGASIRERFHQLFFQERQCSTSSSNTNQQSFKIEDGTLCPVCLEEMTLQEKLIACATCNNLIHDECMTAWKKSSRRRSISCVMCRARWKSAREREDQIKYVNLSAYVSNQDDMVEAD
ncbi:Mitogen-activated protein kinase kinase kinase 1 [Heracleum sosnowskyi]|uniref:Mitogen-activated protein kinase kinase kinase 1 n=1 Tax=Heracleum sosnowskyi TaxID=360622 RepID=A0AAD8MCA3_9APIA|nr:Mitogen-activated protein kinase kinase kinase 1 [Heracleum sosnowskyi]